MTKQKTVKQLASAVGMSPEVLLKKIISAKIDGVTQEDHLLSEEQNKQLLTYLCRKPITLRTKKSALSLGTLPRLAKPPVVVRTIKRHTASNKETSGSKKTAEKSPTIESVGKDPKKASTKLSHVGIQISDLQRRGEKIEESAKVVKTESLTEKPASETKKVKVSTSETVPKQPILSTTGKKTKRKSKAKLRREAIAAGVNKKSVLKSSLLQQHFSKPVASSVKEILIPETITVGNLAKCMAVKAHQVIQLLIQMGEMVSVNQVIDQSLAALIVEEIGHKPKLMKDDAVDEMIFEEEQDYPLLSRPPVVTVMGHVDHGKTTFLDYIRNSKVASSEAGGITQGVGAYHIETKRGVITFIDTPGHAAFTEMRARGAKCTDIVVLVVAADDGVMPQTIEAIQHAKAAKASIVVAINKADKEQADPDRVRSELAQHGLVCEDWGGDTMMQLVSAKTGEGIDALLESILLQAEMMELYAMAEGLAKGLVIEAKRDKQRGVIANVLVQSGVLCQSSFIVAGRQFGRVRLLLDDTGKKTMKVTPSMPASVFGLSDVPEAGDLFWTVPNEKRAREIASLRQRKYREKQLARTCHLPTQLADFKASLGNQEVVSMNIVLKTDVHGSLDAICDALQKLQSNKVKVNIAGSGVGAITESDVNLAIASRAVVLAFNVRADILARRLMQQEKIDVHYFSVIYELIDTVKSSLLGLIGPQYRDEIIGVAKVREVFRSSKLGAIAGCMVEEGTVRRHHPIRVLRDQVVIYQGELESLRRFKEDIDLVKFGDECGIGVKDYNDVRVNDRIEIYQRVEIKATLDSRD